MIAMPLVFLLDLLKTAKKITFNNNAIVSKILVIRYNP